MVPIKLHYQYLMHNNIVLCGIIIMMHLHIWVKEREERRRGRKKGKGREIERETGERERGDRAPMGGREKIRCGR